MKKAGKTFQCSCCSYSCASHAAYKNHLKLHMNNLPTLNTGDIYKRNSFEEVRQSNFNQMFLPPTTSIAALSEHFMLTSDSGLASMMFSTAGNDSGILERKTNVSVGRSNSKFAKPHDLSGVIEESTASPTLQKCSRCSFRTESLVRFKLHIKLHENISRSLIRCIKCNIRCASQQALDQHNNSMHKRRGRANHASTHPSTTAKAQTERILVKFKQKGCEKDKHKVKRCSEVGSKINEKVTFSQTLSVEADCGEMQILEENETVIGSNHPVKRTAIVQKPLFSIMRTCNKKEKRWKFKRSN